MAAGGKAFGVAGRRAGLSNLIHVSEEGKHGLAFAALIHQRFAAAERSAGVAQKTENEIASFAGVNLSVWLFLRPSCTGYKEHFRVGANGLLVLGGCAEAGDRGANGWQLNGNLLD